MPSSAPSPHPYVYECSCGAVRNSPDRHIPVGWSTCAGVVWCGDCTRAGIPARELPRRPRKARRAA